jgi:hypothetical protein
VGERAKLARSHPWPSGGDGESGSPISGIQARGPRHPRTLDRRPPLGPGRPRPAASRPPEVRSRAGQRPGRSGLRAPRQASPYSGDTGLLGRATVRSSRRVGPHPYQIHVRVEAPVQRFASNDDETAPAVVRTWSVSVGCGQLLGGRRTDQQLVVDLPKRSGRGLGRFSQRDAASVRRLTCAPATNTVER